MATTLLNLLKEKAPNTLYRFFSAEISTRAAALSFHTLLALVPALGLIIWYLQSIGVAKHWIKQFEDFLLSHLNVASSESFSRFYGNITSSATGSGWGWVGIGVFAYTSFAVLKKTGDSMDAILKTHELEWNFSRSFFRVMVRRLVVMIGLPLAIIVSIGITAWIRHDSWLRPLLVEGEYSGILSRPIPWIIDCMAFVFLYRFIPRRSISTREAFRAAIYVTPFFEIVKWLIGTYNVYAFSTHKLYGAFSAIPIFFLWIQLAWTILLSGTLFIRNPGKTED